MAKIIEIAAISFALSGCISGKVLTDQAAPAAGAAMLTAPVGVALAIAPLHHPDNFTSASKTQPLQLWITAGWYTVDFTCDALSENGEVVAITIREYTTQRNLRVKAGHAYELSCSPTRMGVLQVRDLGLAPNNSFKPNPLRSFKTPPDFSGGSA